MTETGGRLSGAAILGFYAAIKICIRDGYDWREVAGIVEPIAVEHAGKESTLGRYLTKEDSI